MWNVVARATFASVILSAVSDIVRVLARMPTIAPVGSFVRPSMEVVNVCHRMVVARRVAWGMRLVQQAFSVLTDAVPVEGALKDSAPPAPVMSSVQTGYAWKILDAV